MQSERCQSDCALEESGDHYAKWPLPDSWRRRDTIWTDGSRLGDGRVGAACAWRTPRGWTGRRFHLGINKEIFGAEVYAIYLALSIIDRERESGHRYIISVDSTFAFDRARSDALRPGQHFAVASIEICGRIMDSLGTGTPGGREGRRVRQVVNGRGEPRQHHSRRVPMGDKPSPRRRGQGPHDRLVDHGSLQPRSEIQALEWKGSQKKAAPSSAKAGSELLLPTRIRARGDRPIPERQDPQDRWRQLLVVRGGKRQTTSSQSAGRGFHRSDDFGETWRVLVGGSPQGPLVRNLRKDRATEAVLAFLEDTRVGYISTRREPPEEECDGEDGEEGGPDPP